MRESGGDADSTVSAARSGGVAAALRDGNLRASRKAPGSRRRAVRAGSRACSRATLSPRWMTARSRFYGARTAGSGQKRSLPIRGCVRSDCSPARSVIAGRSSYTRNIASGCCCRVTPWSRPKARGSKASGPGRWRYLRCPPSTWPSVARATRSGRGPFPRRGAQYGLWSACPAMVTQRQFCRSKCKSWSLLARQVTQNGNFSGESVL